MALFLLFGVFFASSPLTAHGSFLSSLVSGKAHAGTVINGKVFSDDSLWTMSLPQAKAFPSSPLSNNKDKDKNETMLDANTSVSILSGNALLSSATPVSSIPDAIGSGDVAFEDISVYVVRSGDTVSQIAKMFGVSEDTILSVNDMKKGAKPKEGEVLLILPYSGVEHKVVKGQTLQGIAKTYKVDLNDILLANDIDADATLVVGEKLMIPGANMLSENKPKATSKTLAKGSKSSSSSAPAIAGYFQNPVPGARRSRGVSATHEGVDLAAPVGTPIYAAAGGKVLTAKMGWNGAYGNMVILQHSNGTKTLYGHMSKLGTTTGAQVSKGDVIGYVGSTGRSTGPHLHFEVLGAKNPF